MRVAPIVAMGLALAPVGCGKAEPPARTQVASVTEVTGTLTIAGLPVRVLGCRPGRGLHTYVVLETPEGALRFEDKALYWNADDPKGFLRGTRLQCPRVDRSWGGGQRADGSAYFRGTLVFDCLRKGGPIRGDLVLDCGNITPDERAQLDASRAETLERQRRAAEGDQAEGDQAEGDRAEGDQAGP